jgi:hypothetical protein
MEGRQRRGFLRAQSRLHLGVDRPRSGHVEAGLQQGVDDGFPGFGGLVSEDDDGNAVGLEHAVDFAECLGEHFLEAPHGVFHTARFAGIGHHLLGLRRERRSE